MGTGCFGLRSAVCFVYSCSRGSKQRFEEKTDNIGNKILSKLDYQVSRDPDFVSVPGDPDSDSNPLPPYAVTNQETKIYFCHNVTTAFNLNFNTWKDK